LKSQPIRADKHCLNCGTEVPGRYCTNCGQENTVPHETFGHLFNHFFADVVHYDSKTLQTLKFLLLKPGLLTKAYTAGKRVRYVNPIKLYIFISFVFFFFYFMLSKPRHAKEEDLSTAPIQFADSVRLPTDEDGEQIVKFTGEWVKQLAAYPTEKEYLQAQKQLPKDKQDGFYKREAAHQFFNQKDPVQKEKAELAKEQFQHNYPKMMFVLLPLFALFLKRLYRKDKRWYYADHAIFSLHFHCFFFIFFLFTTALDWLFSTNFIAELGLIVIFIYLVRSLKNIYGQSTGKAIGKATLLTLMYSFTLLFVFVIFSAVMAFLT
jgi:hypothetical protein